MNRINSNRLFEMPIFNKEGQIFKEFIGSETTDPPIDPYRLANSLSSFDSEQIVGDNDNGAIQNSLEWHLRFQANSISSLNIDQATAVFLDLWGEVLGVKRLVQMNDSGYRRYIKSMLFGRSDSIVSLDVIRKKWGFSFATYEKIGFALNMSFLNEPLRLFTNDKHYAKRTSILVDKEMSRSIIMTDTETSKLGSFDQTLIDELLSNMAVGTEYYIGVIKNISFPRPNIANIPERYTQNYAIQKTGNMPEYEWVNSMFNDFETHKTSVWEKIVEIYTSGNFFGTLLPTGVVRYDVRGESIALGRIIKFCKSSSDNGYFYITGKSGSKFPDFNTLVGSPNFKFNVVYGIPNNNYSQIMETGKIYLQRNSKDEFLHKFVYSEFSKSFEEVPSYFGVQPGDYELEPRQLKEFIQIALRNKLKTFSVVKASLIFTIALVINTKKLVIIAGNIGDTGYFQYSNFFYQGDSPEIEYLNHPEYKFDTVKIGEFKIWN